MTEQVDLMVAAWQASHASWEAGLSASPSSTDRFRDACEALEVAAEFIDSDVTLADRMYDLECEGLDPEVIAAWLLATLKLEGAL